MQFFLMEDSMHVNSFKATTVFLVSALCLVFFTATAAAETALPGNPVPEVTQVQFQPGTDSKGSYSFEEDKTANPNAAPENAPAASAENPAAKKSEGSKAKPQSTKKSEGSKGKSYSHKGKSYSHGKGHHYKGHGHGYSHKKGEGSKGRSYSHGKSYPHGKGEGSKGKHYSYKGKSYPHGKGHHGYKGHGHGYGHKGGHGYRGHGGHHKKMDPFQHVLRFKQKLMLSEDQIAALKKHEFEYKKTKIQAKADKAIAHMELDLLVHSETVDESAIRTIGQRLIAAKSKMINAKIEAKIAVLKVLSPEQRKRVKQMHSRHR